MTTARIFSRHGWLPLCILAGLLSIHQGQDACWDLQNYHLYNAYALFHPARWHDIIFAQSQTYLNPVLDIPLYLLDQAFPRAPRLVAFCMGIPYGLLAFVTLRIATQLFQNIPAAITAALFGLTGSATLSQIGLSTNELFVAPLILASLLLLLRATEPGAQKPLRTILTAGLIAGLATGAKLTAAPYAIGLAAVLTTASRPRHLPASLAIFALAGLTGASVTAGPWMAHLSLAYANPLFPLDNQIFKSPWAALFSYADVRFFPRTQTQWLLYPLYWAGPNNNLVTETPFADPRLAAMSIAAFTAAAITISLRPMRIVPPPKWRAVIIFWLVSYIFWERLFSIYRYAIPLEITAGLIFVGALRALAPSRPALTATAAALATLLIARHTIIPNWGHIPFQPRAIPLSLPSIAPDTLVISSDSAAMSFTALRAPKTTIFIGGNTNLYLPDQTLLSRKLAAAIAAWPGPIQILEPATGDPAGRAALSATYNLTTTDDCRPIFSALNKNALHLCAAHRTILGPNDQPPLNLSFATGDLGPHYGTTGWRTPESFGMWSRAADATLNLPLNPRNTRRLLLTVLCFSIPNATSPGRHEDIYANGHQIAHWSLNRFPESFTATIPPQPGNPTLTLTFHTEDPIEFSAIGDPPTEYLGIALNRLTLLPALN